MQKLREKLYAKLKKKSKFWLDKVTFLGHVLPKDRVYVDPKKVKTVMEWNNPINITKICIFLGLGRYYRKFVEGFLSKDLPLTSLT